MLIETISLIKSPEIIAAFITVGFEVARRIFQPRASVIWGQSHGFAFNIPQNTGGTELVYTKSIFVRNSGRAAAKGVEIYFNFPPEHIEIWPALDHSNEISKDGRFIIKFPFVAKKESFSMELIQGKREPPLLVNVRAVEGKCKAVSMAPMQIFPQWFNIIVFLLMFLGIYQAAVFVIRFLIVL